MLLLHVRLPGREVANCHGTVTVRSQRWSHRDACNEEIMNGLYGFQTPIIFTLSARRLSKGQQFQQLNNMRLEVIRIVGQYAPDDISGIPSFRIVDPGDIPSPTTILGQKSIWYCQVTANVIYNKHYQ